MDCVKAKAWKDFVLKNSILPPAYDRVIRESDSPTPFCLSLKNLEGIDVAQASEIDLVLKRGSLILLLVVLSKVEKRTSVTFLCLNYLYHYIQPS